MLIVRTDVRKVPIADIDLGQPDPIFVGASLLLREARHTTITGINYISRARLVMSLLKPHIVYYWHAGP